MEHTAIFTAQRPRLVSLAGRVLHDPVEAEDVVQQAWLRLHGASAPIEDPAAWLTTVTVRLCLDRLKSRTPTPAQDIELDVRSATEPGPADSTDPADRIALADSVGIALHVVLDRLTPSERVAFVLHDSFGFEFPLIAELLDTTPVAARKLASRARAKVAQPAAEDRLADWEVVDAFLAAARGGEFDRLLQLLAPDALITGDQAARALGTPARIDGRTEVATFFNGAASSALPVFVGERPGAAWFDRGTPRVAFEFTITRGLVERIEFRAEPGLIAALRRRRGSQPR